MHTGVISFCDRIAYNIKSSDTKDEILLHLAQQFQVHILQRHWHRLDEAGIAQLSRSPHFACLRSNGNPYLMYFTKYEDVPIIYFIDKKIQPGYQKPRIILGRGKFDECLFTNTLLEGEMVKDKYGGWLFLINDVIAYQNEFLCKLTLPQRLEYAYRLLADHYTRDTTMDVFRMQVKAYTHATQEGLNSLVEFADTLPYTSRGIYLWPFSTKFKPKLYNFDDSLIKAVTRKVKDNPEFREVLFTSPTPMPPSPKSDPPPSAVSPMPSNKTSDDSVIMWLRKTEFPDVYDVYTSDHGMAQNTKAGVAHVPTLQVSKWLRNEFKTTTVAMYIPFVCKRHEEFDKWIPVSKHVIPVA
jgi:hypothetical protein